MVSELKLTLSKESDLEIMLIVLDNIKEMFAKSPSLKQALKEFPLVQNS